MRHALLSHLNDNRYCWDRSFAFVRHPLAWDESLWKFVNTPGASLDFGKPHEWHPFNDLPIERGVPFDRFVAEIISSRSGFLSEMSEAYIGPENDLQVDVVGRCEELPGSLFRCSEELNVPVDDRQRHAILNCKPAKVSHCNLGNPVLPTPRKRDVLHLERDVVKRWYV